MPRSFIIPDAPLLKCIKTFPAGEAATSAELTFDLNGKEHKVVVGFSWAEVDRYEKEWKVLHDSLPLGPQLS